MKSKISLTSRRERKTKDFELNGNIPSPNLLCYSLCKCTFDSRFPSLLTCLAAVSPLSHTSTVQRGNLLHWCEEVYSTNCEVWPRLTGLAIIM
jgi:hypothetical protein